MKSYFRFNVSQYFTLSILLLNLACATAGQLNRVSIGMSKHQVMEEMGYPDSTKAGNGDEVLVYDLHNCSICGLTSEYWVVIQNGRVVQYGRAGDFNTSTPTQKVIIQEDK